LTNDFSVFNTAGLIGCDPPPIDHAKEFTTAATLFSLWSGARGNNQLMIASV
jgi:hypothetical protein